MENKNQSQPKKKIRLSVIIEDPKDIGHKSGVNRIKYEPIYSSGKEDKSKSNNGCLFTAGRDSTIRVFNKFNPLDPIFMSKSSNASGASCSVTMCDHTDWVNDIAYCKYSQSIFSASSDTTVKMWNWAKGSLINTFRLHRDYVKCLTYAKDKQLLASAGFDKNIFLWDVSQGVALNPNGMNVQSISDNKYSIYSLAINNQATIMASGSPENCVRLWDPRTCNKVMKLKGHTHNIRCLVLSRDGTQYLSASSDHTIRLWSLSQQRCISTIDIHTEGVWTLCVNESFTKVYSGGKDNRVFATDLRNLDESILVCEETAPVLSIDFGREQESLWVSTINSSVKNWSLKPSAEQTTTFSSKPNSASGERSQAPISQQPQKLTNSATTLRNINANEVSNRSSSSSISSSFLSQSPMNTQPLMVIKGTTSIKQYHILNDKRFVVTKDSDENVCVWDVLQARKTEWLGKENYENAIKVRQRFISIPNWFTVDLKLGVLTVNIDENDWQAAWINFKDMDSNHVRQTQNIDLSEARVNYGYIFLESLFKNCTFLNPSRLETCTNVVMPQSTSSQNQNNPANNTNIDNKSPNKNEEHGQAGLLRFTIPDHTPVIFSEVAGRTLYRLDVKDMSKDSEQQPLSNVMPSWIVDALFGKTAPKFNRINFILNPYNQSQLKTVNKDRLISYDLLQVKKVKEYVYSKILKLDQINNTLNNESNNTQSFTSSQQQQQPQSAFNDSNNNNYKSNEINSNNSSTTASSYSTNQQPFTTSTNLTGAESTSAKEQFNVINRTIELICSDQILNDPDMNLRTVKHLIWKGNGDLTILFRTKQ